MTLTVNGRPEPLPGQGTVSDLVARRGLAPTGVAVAVNGTVVRAADWASTRLRDGDAVEVVTARQGG
jgi:sulfur carrier protein